MSFKFSLLSDLVGENNAHMQGIKHVFVNNSDTESALTQFAFGVMQTDQKSGLHAHATMDEYFYFIKGNGIYYIDDSVINVVPSSFIRIPAGAKHNLVNTGAIALEFVYFGIAL